MILHFSKVSKFAGVLLIPYLLWVSFATLLNFSLWILNS
jgi:tryptophan-rich sensory protein